MKPDKPHNGGTWTDARKTSFIMSALRNASRRWGPAYACKKAARVARNAYTCAICQKVYGSKDVKIDHIRPVRSVYQIENSWDKIIKRMFPEISGYQVLCKACHDDKTDIENNLRREIRKAVNQTTT